MQYNPFLLFPITSSFPTSPTLLTYNFTYSWAIWLKCHLLRCHWDLTHKQPCIYSWHWLLWWALPWNLPKPADQSAFSKLFLKKDRLKKKRMKQIRLCKSKSSLVIFFFLCLAAFIFLILLIFCSFIDWLFNSPDQPDKFWLFTK